MARSTGQHLEDALRTAASSQTITQLLRTLEVSGNDDAQRAGVLQALEQSDEWRWNSDTYALLKALKANPNKAETRAPVQAIWKRFAQHMFEVEAPRQPLFVRDYRPGSNFDSVQFVRGYNWELLFDAYLHFYTHSFTGLYVGEESSGWKKGPDRYAWQRVLQPDDLRSWNRATFRPVRRNHRFEDGVSLGGDPGNLDISRVSVATASLQVWRDDHTVPSATVAERQREHYWEVPESPTPPHTDYFPLVQVRALHSGDLTTASMDDLSTYLGLTFGKYQSKAHLNVAMHIEQPPPPSVVMRTYKWAEPAAFARLAATVIQ
jgi:hypothetical protein